MWLLKFRDSRVEAAFVRHFPVAQLTTDVIFNGVLSAVTLSSSIRFVPQFPMIEKVRVAWILQPRSWPGACC